MKSPIRSPKRLSTEAEKVLLNYDFPGNIRELEHIIERALIFAENDSIELEDLNLPTNNIKGISRKMYPQHEEESGEILSIDEIEKIHIAKALKTFGWDRAQTASHLGISPKTLYTKIKKYELKQE